MRIERRVVILGPGPYGGMDRPALGSRGDVPHDTVVRALACEAAQDVAGCRRLLIDLARGGVDDYEIVALGGWPGSAWDFLGFDVGETTSAAWSAVQHRAEVFDADQAAAWGSHLNEHGLFHNPADADAFLQAYRQADDPDAGEDPAIYSVVPVQRLRRSATRPDTVLWYTIGNEHSPSDPFGRIVLVLTAGGAAELEHHSRMGDTVWQGDVHVDVLERVTAELARGGFPEVAPHPVPACSAIRQIEITVDGDPRCATMAESAGSAHDGYKEAFAMLDSLAVQLSRGTYKGTRDTLEPSVSNVRKVK